MVRRTIRMGFRLGLLAGLGFALFKLVKSLRGPSLSGGSEWAAPSSRTSPSGRPAGETPLVETSMLNGVTLRKAEGRAAANGGGGDGQSGSPSSARQVGPQPGVEPSAAAGFPMVPERPVVPESRAPAAMPESPSPSAAPKATEEAVPGASATGDTTTEGAAANGTGKRAGAAKKAAKTSRAGAAKVSAAAKRAARAWVDPKGAFCPSSHPIKAKLSSGIYHLPGMLAYDRTTPDRCYQSEDGAENDGLRKAKR